MRPVTSNPWTLDEAACNSQAKEGILFPPSILRPNLLSIPFPSYLRAGIFSALLIGKEAERAKNGEAGRAGR